jgi:hypothetical protein
LQTVSLPSAQCLTPNGTPYVTSKQSSSFFASGAGTSPPVTLPAGNYTFSTKLSGAVFVSNTWANATTTVMITDGAAPVPPLDVCYDCGISGG